MSSGDPLGQCPNPKKLISEITTKSRPTNFCSYVIHDGHDQFSLYFQYLKV